MLQIIDCFFWFYGETIGNKDKLQKSLNMWFPLTGKMYSFPCGREWWALVPGAVEASKFSRQSIQKWRQRSQPKAPATLSPPSPPPQKDSWYSSLLKDEWNPGSYALIRNRPCGLQACCIVSGATMRTRATAVIYS
jgi:hypothetical protein